MGIFDTLRGFTGHTHCWHPDTSYPDSVRYCCVPTCDLMQWLEDDPNDYNSCQKNRKQIWVNEGKYGSRFSM